MAKRLGGLPHRPTKSAILPRRPSKKGALPHAPKR